MKEVELTDIPFDAAEFTVLDFETTGTSVNYERVIEVGIVKVKKLKITETYQSFINPGRGIPSFITNLTGIKNSDVDNAPYFEGLVKQITEFVGDSIITAHNLNFDYSFLKNEFNLAGHDMLNNPTLCTLKLARKIFPHLKSKSLGSLVKHFRLRHRGVHRALGDATATAKLLIKMLKVLKEDHGIDTTSDLLNFQSFPQTKSTFRIIKKKLAGDFAGLPDTPGVYFFKDSKDKIIYIGKAKLIKQRVKNYFSNTAPRKSKKIARSASRLGFQATNSELTALLKEADLIKEHNPVHNSMLKKYSQQYYIKVNLQHEVPDVKLVSKFAFDGNDYFGPYNNRETTKKLIEIVDKTFQLRECKNKELSKHKKCYLADIHRCLAPCVDNSIFPEYNSEINKVYEFLSGENQNALDRLLKKMKGFSNNKKYEEAAGFRDMINLVLTQLNKSSILAEPINNANVLIEVNDTQAKDFILMLNGKVFIRGESSEEKDYFNTVLDDYFAGTVHLFPDIENKDLEGLKIALSWFIKNRNKVKVYYLKHYTGVEELLSSAQFPKKHLLKKNIKEVTDVK